MSGGGIKTVNPDAQKYVEPTLQKYPDFPKSKIHNLKMPSFKELTTEDKKNFLKNATLMFALSSIISLIATLLISGNNCPAPSSVANSLFSQDSSALSLTFSPVKDHQSQLAHSHLVTQAAVDEQGFIDNLKQDFLKYLTIFQAYLSVGCNSFLVQAIIGALVLYGVSCYKDRYPEDFDNYFKKSPMDTNLTNAMAIIKAAFYSVLGCYIGNIQIVYYVIILLILIFLAHSMYVSFSKEDYSRNTAYGLCVVVLLLLLSVMIYRNNLTTSNNEALQWFIVNVDIQTVQFLAIASLIGVIFAVVIIKVMNDRIDDPNFDFDSNNLMGFAGGFDLSLMSAPLFPLIKLTTCMAGVFSENCFKKWKCIVNCCNLVTGCRCYYYCNDQDDLNMELKILDTQQNGDNGTLTPRIGLIESNKQSNLFSIKNN